MAQVALEGVTKRFPAAGPARKRAGTAAAVNNLHLEVRDEEFVVLVGPSGCGKSTTLRIIAGLETADEGTVRIGDRVVNQVAPKDRNIAMVFQNYALYPHMTVYKNIAFGLELRTGGGAIDRLFRRITAPPKAREVNEERKAIKHRVHETARTLGIETLLDRMPGQLSGGERQRVALGRAIVRQPAAFLFDEPLSNLDARLRVEMRRELKELHQRLRATMIYVTHDQVEALTLGDRIVVMDRGEVQQIGAPEEVYDRPRNRFVAGFIGSPAMNLLEGRLHSSGEGIQFQCPGVRVPLEAADAAPETPAVLGVRPEDVSLAKAGDGRAVARARITVVESLGDASLVHARVEAASEAPVSLVAKAEARTAMRRGDVVQVRLNPSRIHLFDQQTGENLAAGKAAPVVTA
ncbi:MAG: ABC transporter ATP-binding protein [Planctomycetes bacterium]|nr:ABC transporter ATP-binding protein [Planctomycetota bacterium]